MILNFRSGSAFASKKAKKYLKNVSPEEIKKITVIRHAAIGDFMNIRPFLIELRSYFPNSFITLSVDRNAMYGLPEDLIDHVHIMDKKYPSDKSKSTSFFSRVKQARELPEQDIIFDLTDSSLTLLLIFFSEAKLKIGYSYRTIRRMFYDISILRSDFVIEAESVLHMLNMLGAKTTRALQYGYDKKYPKNDRKQILYFAGAAMQSKCWEKEKFKDLISKTSEVYRDYDHIILQGIKENEKFLEIYNPLKEHKNVKLQEAMDLDKTMQLLSDCRCVVSNDTGVRNMAIAVNTPTIGIFFATGAFRYWPRDGRHDCVFNNQYLSPNLDDVYSSLKKLMDKLYEK